MQVSGATTDLASKGQGVSDSSNIKFKEEPEPEISHKTEKVRCLCGSSLQADSMIKVTFSCRPLFCKSVSSFPCCYTVFVF